jgi:hypothetical protein
LDSYPDLSPPKDKTYDSAKRIHKRRNREDIGGYLNRGRRVFVKLGQEKNFRNFEVCPCIIWGRRLY